ncbi:MAG: thioredoxin family protein [Propionicimonas sp.]|uniref:thioredoxin family protein n=1 Tax=Propionicimonas sp. TaxID=1955623 RepID=UPI003D0C4340
MTGVWIVVAAVALALAFGGYRRLTDGRVRAVATSSAPRLDASRLGSELGSDATFVQFSSAVCAPCRATHRLLAEVTGTDPKVAHVDLDAETHLDLVEEFGITRTPTVLLLDADGVVQRRIVGAARRADVLTALEAVSGRAAA